MAKPNSLLMKIVFIGVPVLIGVALLPTNPSTGDADRPTRGIVKPSKKSDLYAADRNVTPFPSTSSAATDSLKPGTLPNRLTNSKDPWVYVGNVEGNGKKQALLENKATGEAVFLSPGDFWQGLKVLSVDGDSIVVSGTSGVGGTPKVLSFDGLLPGNDNLGKARPFSQE